MGIRMTEEVKKEQIKSAMEKITRRRLGNSKLVYDRARKRIIVVNQRGEYVRDARITFHDD